MESSCEPPEEFLEASWDTWGHHESLLGAAWKLLGAPGVFPGEVPKDLRMASNLEPFVFTNVQEFAFTQPRVNPNCVHTDRHETKLGSREPA